MYGDAGTGETEAVCGELRVDVFRDLADESVIALPQCFDNSGKSGGLKRGDDVEGLVGRVALGHGSAAGKETSELGPLQAPHQCG